MVDNLANWSLAVAGSYQFVIRVVQEDIDTIGGYSTGCQAIRRTKLSTYGRRGFLDLAFRQPEIAE